MRKHKNNKNQISIRNNKKDKKSNSLSVFQSYEKKSLGEKVSITNIDKFFNFIPTTIKNYKLSIKKLQLFKMVSKYYFSLLVLLFIFILIICAWFFIFKFKDFYNPTFSNPNSKMSLRPSIKIPSLNPSKNNIIPSNDVYSHLKITSYETGGTNGTQYYNDNLTEAQYKESMPNKYKYHLLYIFDWGTFYMCHTYNHNKIAWIGDPYIWHKTWEQIGFYPDGKGKPINGTDENNYEHDADYDGKSFWDFSKYSSIPPHYCKIVKWGGMVSEMVMVNSDVPFYCGSPHIDSFNISPPSRNSSGKGVKSVMHPMHPFQAPTLININDPNSVEMILFSGQFNTTLFSNTGCNQMNDNFSTRDPDGNVIYPYCLATGIPRAFHMNNPYEYINNYYGNPLSYEDSYENSFYYGSPSGNWAGKYLPVFSSTKCVPQKSGLAYFANEIATGKPGYSDDSHFAYPGIWHKPYPDNVASNDKIYEKGSITSLIRHIYIVNIHANAS